MEVTSAHRKIELQAPEDLAYLLDNVRRAATARVEEAFPPVDGAHGEDELRVGIEDLVDQVGRCFFCLSDSRPSTSTVQLIPSILTPRIPVHRRNVHPCLAEPFYQWPPRRPRHITLAG